MAVDRNLWSDSFVDELPHWPCPTCNKGYLAAAKEKLWIEETGPSKAAHDHDAWDPDWIENRFVALAECSMPACKELAAVCGSTSIDHMQVDHDEYLTRQIFKIASIVPAPVPIAYPDNTPKPIIDAIRRASTLVWPSYESAANQIRQAVECLMDDVGINPTNASGKPIKLHDRIVQFQGTDRENGNVLLATKWLGNSGSHVGGMSRDAVLDAFDMLEFVLENRYGTTKADLMAKVAAINAAKGPVQQT
jgi:Domain of unknown function (DUF4145)